MKISTTKVDQPLYNANYSLSEIDTGRIWIDGKPIYSRVWSGNTGAGASSTVALGVNIDSLCPGCEFMVDTASYGWEATAANTGNGPGWWFTNATQNGVTLYHNSATTQSRPYRLILEYTKV